MNHLGQETALSIGGRSFLLSRYTRRILRELLTWGVAKLPDPFNATRNLDDLPPHVQAVIAKDLTEWGRVKRSVYNPLLLDLWTSLEGRVFEFGLLLAKHHPGMTGDDVGELYGLAALEHGDDYLAERFLDCMGRMPPDESEEERRILALWGLMPDLDPAPRSRIEPENWQQIDKALVKHFSFRPWEIEELTTTEIMFLFSTLKDEAKEILPSVAMQQAEAYHKLSPQQKLELARMAAK